MQHFWSLSGVYLRNAWLTIGSFDGVHRGHQEIIKQLTAGAHSMSAPAVVLTFYPHPSVVLGKRQNSFYLTTPEERAALLGDLGVDFVISHPFNLNVAAMSAQEFMVYLKTHLGLQHLIVGHDFALGKGREGDVNRLSQIGEELGYSVHTVSPFKIGDQVVSSSQIRQALAEGNVEQAAVLLGRRYQLTGEVIPGDRRGRLIGSPTANLRVWAQRALPKAGVYVCRAWIGGQSWGAVANIGFRPTFEQQTSLPQVEAHILDFDRYIYGRKVRLEFISHLRDEQRFPDVEALVSQIQRDIKRTREILAELSQPG